MPQANLNSTDLSSLRQSTLLDQLVPRDLVHQASLNSIDLSLSTLLALTDPKDL